MKPSITIAKLQPIYTNEDLKSWFHVKSLDTVVNKLESLGIKYTDEGSGKARMITVWLVDIENARPDNQRNIGRYQGDTDILSDVG